MKTERIELGDGVWWEVRTVKTVAMARASEEVVWRYVGPKILANNGGEYDLKEVNLFEVTRALVLAATVAWNYGPVTEQVFNDIPQADYEKVAGRCNELFGSLPLAARSSES